MDIISFGVWLFVGIGFIPSVAIHTGLHLTKVASSSEPIQVSNMVWRLGISFNFHVYIRWHDSSYKFAVSEDSGSCSTQVIPLCCPSVPELQFHHGVTLKFAAPICLLRWLLQMSEAATMSVSDVSPDFQSIPTMLTILVPSCFNHHCWCSIIIGHHYRTQPWHVIGSCERQKLAEIL